MRARALLILLASLSLAGVAAGTADAATEPQLSPVGRVRFPERAFLVSLPEHQALSGADVELYENGKRVVDPSLVPALTSGKQLGIVLAIDASNSMRGAPLAAAYAAARTFVAAAGPNESVGILSFNRASARRLAPTSDPAALRRGLASPPKTAGGTHLYDAAGDAIAMLARANVAAGSVVLISDGGDTGSSLDAATVVARARAGRVRIFTVGLRSADSDPAALKKLASSTRGRYAQASSPAQLASIYRSFGTELANEYLLRYRSAVRPGTHVQLRIELPGGATAAADYTAVEPRPTGAYRRPLGERFWASPVSLLVIGFLASLLVFAAVLALLHGPRSNLRERIGHFVSTTAARGREGRRESSRLTQAVLGRAERSLSRTRWWGRFEEELELAEIRMPAVQIAVCTLLATLVVGLLLILIAPVFSVFALAVPVGVRALCARKLRAVRNAFAEQLPDNLHVLASALRAGHSFVGALSVVAADADEPSRREFQRVVADEQLGVPVEQSLREVGRRMASRDLDQVALVAELQRQTGGNMAEVLDRVVETIRQRFDVRRLVKTLTAQGRMARWIVSLLPVFLFALISVINPTYERVLYSSGGGQVALVVAALMIIGGSYAVKRIVDIKV